MIWWYNHFKKLLDGMLPFIEVTDFARTLKHRHKNGKNRR